MAASDVMERCSGGEMWFERQPLNWKIRRRTKALHGWYQTRLRPLMCWSLLLHSSGTREQNIGGFTEAQEVPGWLLVQSGGSFFPPSVSQRGCSDLVSSCVLCDLITSGWTPLSTGVNFENVFEIRSLRRTFGGGLSHIEQLSAQLASSVKLEEEFTTPGRIDYTLSDFDVIQCNVN